MADFLEIDFCKQRTVRVNRRFDVSDGITSEQLAGATSLGCNFPVSHRDNGVGPGVILSRVNKQSGKDVSDLFTSPNESIQSNPGPTAWLSAAPDRILTGSITTPFPAARPVVNDTLIAGGASVSRIIPTAGFGEGSGFRSMVVVPPGDLEYIDPGPLADHQALRRFKTVSSSNALEAYGLVYRDQLISSVPTPKYVWGSTFGSTGFRTSDDGIDWEHSIFFTWYGTPPALLGDQEPILTPPIAVAGVSPIASTNGPDQTSRKYSHPIVHGQFINPAFNETLDLESELTGTRPTLTIFSQSLFDAQFGYSEFTVDGNPVNFAGTSLPTDQYIQNVGFGFPENNGFSTGIFKPSPASSQNFQVYGPIDQGFSYNVPLAATSVTFQFNVVNTTNPAPVIIVANMPKAANQSAWMELWVFVRSRHVGAL